MFQVNIDSENHAVTKCYLPDEKTVVYTYIAGGAGIVLWLLYRLCCWRRQTMLIADQYYGSKSH